MAPTDSTPGKAPAFQFYPSDFVNGTLTLTTEEVGAYMLLMCHCWDKGSIPADITLLSRIARLSPAKMRRVWVSIAGKFLERDGVYIQARLEIERQKQQEYRRRQSDAAAKRWDKRGNATASERDMPSGMPDDALRFSSSSSSSSKSKSLKLA